MQNACLMKSLHQYLTQICSKCLIDPRDEVFPEFVRMNKIIYLLQVKDAR